MYNLKIRRQEAGMTQRDLAEASGVDIRLIQHYEAEGASSHRDINVAAAMSVWRMAQALGVEVIDILEPEEV